MNRDVEHGKQELDSETVTPSDSFQYYTNTIYWNDFEIIREHINQQISGSRQIGWEQYVRNKLGTFECGFFFNCGNGWVERELFKLGIIKSAIGIDFNTKTIAEAIDAARSVGMSAQYHAGDINKFGFLKIRPDLVVNHAAMHHVAYVNRVTCELAKLLQPNGYYIAFDYVGAHRNQYSSKMWTALLEFNSTLPTRFQGSPAYPHMRTMMHTDPTEAIHSELQVEVMQRYFDIEKYSLLGGPLAYHILFNNQALFNERHTAEGMSTLERLMRADTEFCRAHPELNLFAFWIARPRNLTFPHSSQIAMWQHEENIREIAASRNNGRYYPPTDLELAYGET